MRSALLDATPDQLCYPIAAATAHLLFPHVKLLVLLRPPLARARAAWEQSRRLGTEGRLFAKAVDDELPTLARCAAIAPLLATVPHAQWYETATRFNAACHPPDGPLRGCWMTANVTFWPPCKRYLMKGLSANYIDNWLRFFAPDQLLVLNSETFFRVPKLITTKVLSWLHLDPAVASRIAPKRCWHNCGGPKTAVRTNLSEAVLDRLTELYAPSQERLQWHIRCSHVEGATEDAAQALAKRTGRLAPRAAPRTCARFVGWGDAWVNVTDPAPLQPPRPAAGAPRRPLGKAGGGKALGKAVGKAIGAKAWKVVSKGSGKALGKALPWPA